VAVILQVRGGLPVASLPPAGSFSTTFAGSEAPISESGVWQTADGSNFSTWTATPPFKSSGVAFGGSNASAVQDSVAFLKPSVGILPTQTVTVVCFVGGTFSAVEMEVHLRSTWNATQIFSYELDFVPGSLVVGAAKWIGNNGSFFSLPYTGGTTGAIGTVVSGDVFDCKVFDLLPGTSIRLQVFKNTVLVGQWDDSLVISGSAPYASGSIGIGGDNGGAQTQNFGWDSLSVVSS